MTVTLTSWKALGTSVHVLATNVDGLERATTAVREVVEDVDAVYSRFRDDSELSRLNAAAGRVTRVGPLLATAIEAALRAARLTDGAVDPTIGHAIRLAGYDDDFTQIAADRGPLTLRAWRVPGWQAIAFDRRSRTVLLPRGVELDLGSTGKALAADLAATAALAAAGSGGVLVSLGGDIAVAGEPPDRGWPVRIADDHAAPLDGPGPTVSISAGGLASSGTHVRRWTTAGGELHHIIDPRTARPAVTPWKTVSVAAASCVHANAASTAAIVLGESAVGWLEQQGLPARLAGEDGTVATVNGWPADVL